MLISLVRLLRTDVAILAFSSSSNISEDIFRLLSFIFLYCFIIETNTLETLLLKIFTDITCKTGRAILRVYPSPWDIVDKDINEVKEELKIDERNKGILYRLVNEYLVLCKELYRDTIKINVGDREEVKIYLYQYEMLEHSLNEINISIKKLTRETIDAYDKIIKIKGIGDSEINSLLEK